MSPMIFAYVIVLTALLAGAAAAIEWAAQGRVRARRLWTATMLLSIVAPPAVIVGRAALHRAAAARASIAANVVHTRSNGQDVSVVVFRPSATVASEASELAARDVSIRRVLPAGYAAYAALSRFGSRLAHVAAYGWLLLSLAMVAWLTIGIIRWRRLQRVWQRTTLDGVDVDMSARTGPAVLGILSNRIVLPQWVTALAPEYRRLVLAHECEHISARDPQRLAVAIAALVVMPWNLALWWCAARLRRAIELDCDARVLQRFPNAKEYGCVLLEVASRGRNTGPLAVPMVALLGLPSELELRLRAMTRPRSPAMRTVAAGGALALVAICAAFAAPAPSLHSTRLAAIGRSAAATVRRLRTDTVPRVRSTDAARQTRQLDSVNVLLRRLQDSQLQMERSRTQLALASAALQAAERDFKLSDSARAAIEAERPRMYGIVTAHMGGLGSAEYARRAAEEKARVSEIDHIQVRISLALRSRYPKVLSDPTGKSASIWFVADSSGKVLRSVYDPVFPRDGTESNRLRNRFPAVNPEAVGSITNMRPAARPNLSVTWVQMKGDPSRYFITPK